MVSTRDWQKLEGGMVFISSLCFAFVIGLPFPVWIVPIAFLLPDVSILAYSAGRSIGAFAFNATHNYGFGTLIALAGLLSGSPDIMWAGLLFFSRAGLDRMLGNGLKRTKGFRYTHTGLVWSWFDHVNDDSDYNEHPPLSAPQSAHPAPLPLNLEATQ